MKIQPLVVSLDMPVSVLYSNYCSCRSSRDVRMRLAGKKEVIRQLGSGENIWG
jgi:hypothetical protein